MSQISVLILTKNEQQDLPGCLDTLAWCDDIHVYDSMSTDDTVSIAKRYAANVIQRPFDNWSSHQNWGLDNIPFKHPWVYYSDADERVTPELARAMQEAVMHAGDLVAFRIRRRDYLFGRWLKHVTPSPFNIRLFKPQNMRYERLTNPVSKVDGKIGDISEHFSHFPFSKGISFWLEKHNSYSTLEAKQIIENAKNDSGFSLKKVIFSKDPNIRRHHQKELYYRLPFRPIIMFFMLYIVKMGFLDGRSGFIYATLRSIYEYMILLKVRESREKP